MFQEIGRAILTYAPFWLQVGYVLVLTAFKPDPWPTVPADICFAGFAFFVWGVTMHMSANRRVAGGGRYRSTRQSRVDEIPWLLVILLLSIVGIGTGYKQGLVVAVAYISAVSIALLTTRLLMPPRGLAKVS